MRTFSRCAVAALTVLAAACLPAPAEAQGAPEPVAETGGIYLGTVTVEGRRCGPRCRIRIVVTSDGLEIRTSSTVLGGRHRRGCDGGRFDLGPIRSDGRWRSWFYDGLYWMPIRGRFSRDGRRVRGRGRIMCPVGTERRMRFRARLVGRRLDRRGAVLRCERLVLPHWAGRRSLMVSVQRDLGCGRAHHAARRFAASASCRSLTPHTTCRVSGLECRGVATGGFDPATQARCVPPPATAPDGAVVEIVRFKACEKSSEVYPYVSRAGCEEARALAERWFEECDDLSAECRVGGYACRPTEEPRYTRCARLGDQPAYVELEYDPGIIV